MIRRLLPVFPLAAGGVGLFIMARHEASPARLGLQAAGLLAGLLLSWAISSLASERLCGAAFLASPIGLGLLGATFAGEGLLGVHRWIRLGPVMLNVSSVATPIVVLAASACFARRRWLAAAALVGATQVVHFLQPDAGQALALALAGVAAVLFAPHLPRVARAVAIAALAASAVLIWARPDPLPPVADVEGIVGLAGDQGLLVRLLAIASVAIIPASSALAAREAPPGSPRTSAIALAGYVTGVCTAPLAGNFPVPVLGFGVSPILGVALCAGAVATLGSMAVSRSAPVGAGDARTNAPEPTIKSAASTPRTTTKGDLAPGDGGLRS